MRTRVWLALPLVGLVGCYLQHGPPGEAPLDEGPDAVGSVRELSAGRLHTCARLADGRVFCWGGGAGVGSGVPARLPFAEAALRLAAAADALCLGTADGRVRCTDGSAPRLDGTRPLAAGGYGVCGSTPEGDFGCAAPRSPVRVQPGHHPQAFAVGRAHVCLVEDGGVSCFGDNASGQLGDGSTARRDAPVRVAALDRVIEVSAGGEHTCALDAAGRVSCWGRAAEGQLGDGESDHGHLCSNGRDMPADCGLEPVRVLGLRDAVHVAAGAFHTCALREDGSAACWGSNAFGRLGDGLPDHGRVCGDADCSLGPVAVDIGEPLAAVAAGDLHTCARSATDHVFCWGANASGQLGDGTYRAHDVPFPVDL